MEDLFLLWSRAARALALILLVFSGLFWLLDRTLFNWGNDPFAPACLLALVLILWLVSWWLRRMARQKE
ncbi:hypothetical protein E5F05_08425 [Deinococcus metallilatus]|uniref:Flagellar biogenesis protein FliO n=1 Tax=Deinococcus metallilatus TaxID=1211322 RepID=A0AAJ5K548_9DEIO|nr:hypothetical protein [Deinococcus metallilatus]MBB5295510.1 flagellar biogenesis protein FliO [Deinococcus metallilatus]QBY07975.1 hypothetical protein E5F05_08425 [Deinococcus metallilatus]RXJ12868.1 hypothetical protein ERJ73_07250 [Deinococcus metallilatus]TLK27210.1 hypothetical protein FCS05_10065 [Deinococcus metallilatus]GMA16188.1 hypothetical protein GCM10025871_25190 [Deinococcus metallilatus]